MKVIHLLTHKYFSKGQALVLMAIAFLVLLVLVGLATDVGMLFISMGTLRRAVDAGSLAAAAQFREARTVTEMNAAAEQVIGLNGIDPGTFTVTTLTCENAPGDPNLCTTPRRKLVRVVGTYEAPTFFLRLVGVDSIGLTADSISEAASLDVVLVIDLSESMTWDAPPGDPMRDPKACNDAEDCHPFEEVKAAATNFARSILNKPEDQEEDRLQIVTFANGWSTDPGMGTEYRFVDGDDNPLWTSNVTTAITAISNLEVFEPGRCYPAGTNGPPAIPITEWGPCRYYAYDEPSDEDLYQYLDCISCREYDDWSALPTTNIGGGLLLAGNMFTYEQRDEALWVVVVLTDGMANTTDREESDDVFAPASYPIGFCPDAQDGPPVFPMCQDEDVDTHHDDGTPEYDADDYARDMADFVGCLSVNPAPDCADEGQGAIIFAIGLGDGVQDNGCDRGVCEGGGLEIEAKPYGASLLRYIAAVGDDGNSDTDPCALISDYTRWCGNYYFAPEGPQLSRIFEDIASRIFTRITH
jgi:hypothetical protein